jgi:anti-sigma regulatory factor (Ser/Thr protein kinase)
VDSPGGRAVPFPFWTDWPTSRRCTVRLPGAPEASSQVDSRGTGQTTDIDAHISLRPEPTQVAVARRFVADTLEKWGIRDLQEVASLLVSELVTNSVVHAGSDITLTLSSEGPQVRFEVRDGSAHPPVDLNVPLPSPNGRGVRIVAAMAADWGVESVPDHGKAVWFTLRVPEPGE